MNRVSTAANYSAVLANLTAAQSRQNEAGEQVASQKKATDLKGYARNAETLTAMRSMQVRVDGFLESTSRIADKLQVQDVALGQITDGVKSAREAIANALATGRGDTIMQELAAAFSDVTSGLNTKHQGQYLFSGGQVNTLPVTATGLSSLTAGPPIASLFQNGTFITSHRLDESTSVQSGFLADQIGTDAFTAFQTVQTFEEGGTGNFGGPLTEAQRQFLEGQLAGFDQVHKNLLQVAGQNGLLQNRADDIASDLSNRKDMLANMMGGLTDVDMAEAVSRLQQAQLSVQAAAQVFVSLNGSSLLNVLR